MAASECRVATNAQGRELAEHGSALFPVACYADDLTTEEVAWHWHDELEVLVMLEGRTAVAAGGRRFELKAGEGAFINGGVLHGMRNAGSGPCRFHSLVFHPRLVGGGVDSIFWHKYLQPLLTDTALECVAFGPETPWQVQAMQAIEAAWQACAGEAPGYEFAVRAGLSQVVGLLVSRRASRPAAVPEKTRRDGERIKRMLRYIQENYAAALTAREIAASAALSVSECLRCFHSTIGVTPIRYLRQFRIQKAAELLADTPLEIGQIAARCGFQEMSYFARAFRAEKGCTPSDYRMRQRGGQPERKSDRPETGSEK